MAGAEISHHVCLVDAAADLGADPSRRWRPSSPPLDTFHESTRPNTWLEGLVKAYVGDGLAADFYREIAEFLPEPDRTIVQEVLADTGHADFAVREVRAAIAADRRVAGRLALWARRLVGEAITRTQAVVAERDELGRLIIEGMGDLGGVARLIDGSPPRTGCACARWACAADPGPPTPPRPSRMTVPRPLLSAHRGGPGPHADRENTLPALLTRSLDCEYVEFDVQRCRGGVHVLYHDATVPWPAGGCPSRRSFEEFAQHAGPTCCWTTPWRCCATARRCTSTSSSSPTPTTAATSPPATRCCWSSTSSR